MRVQGLLTAASLVVVSCATVLVGAAYRRLLRSRSPALALAFRNKAAATLRPPNRVLTLVPTNEGSDMPGYSVVSGCALALLVSTTAISADARTDLAWMREDIAAFREKFLAIDKSFTTEARAAAEARLERLERRAPSISPEEYVVELCRIAALSDNAHTGCLPDWLGHEICRQWAVIEGSNSNGCTDKEPTLKIAPFGVVPINFRPFSSNFHVIATSEKDADLLGARVVAVNENAIEDIREVLRSFSGGTIASRELKAAEVLSSPLTLHAVGIGKRTDTVTYSLLTRAGKLVERTFESQAESAATITVRLPDATRAHWTFQELSRPFRYLDAPDLNAVIIQLRQNVDSPTIRIREFLREAEERRAEAGRQHVVLDMRFNGGGNLMLTRDFMAEWPSRMPGRFYVLTSAQTFSAGIASIAYLKQAGADRVVIVGEPVGDRLMFFSDGRPIQLPNSGLFLLPSPVRMDFHDGCRRYDDCFAGVSQPGRSTAALPAGVKSVKRMPLAVASLEPDVYVPWTIESWLNGVDPMLEAVHAVIGGTK
jgi:hypothetical protein